MRDTKEKLSVATVALHWIVAIIIVPLWALGYYMASVRNYRLWPWHISTGAVLFVIILARLAWRLRNGWPKPVRDYPAAERWLARSVQWTIVLAMLIMPMSGLISSYAGGYDITVFGWQIIPDVPNHAIVPANALHKARVTPRNEALHDGLQKVHITVGWILAAAVLLHIAGALKHHLIDKDGTLRRMLGAAVP